MLVTMHTLIVELLERSNIKLSHPNYLPYSVHPLTVGEPLMVREAHPGLRSPSERLYEESVVRFVKQRNPPPPQKIGTC